MEKQDLELMDYGFATSEFIPGFEVDYVTTLSPSGEGVVTK